MLRSAQYLKLISSKNAEKWWRELMIEIYQHSFEDEFLVSTHTTDEEAGPIIHKLRLQI